MFHVKLTDLTFYADSTMDPPKVKLALLGHRCVVVWTCARQFGRCLRCSPPGRCDHQKANRSKRSDSAYVRLQSYVEFG
jgi:hypothetical protein